MEGNEVETVGGTLGRSGLFCQAKWPQKVALKAMEATEGLKCLKQASNMAGFAL